MTRPKVTPVIAPPTYTIEGLSTIQIQLLYCLIDRVINGRKGTELQGIKDAIEFGGPMVLSRDIYRDWANRIVKGRV